MLELCRGSWGPRRRLLSLSAVVSLSDSLHAATSYLCIKHPPPLSLVPKPPEQGREGRPLPGCSGSCLRCPLLDTRETGCSNYLGFTASPCLPPTHMESHLKARMPSILTNPFIKGRICSRDTKRPALISIGRRKVSANSCEQLGTRTGDKCLFSLFY